MNKQLLTILGSALLLAACATTPRHEATHRWVSEKPMPRTVYVRDQVTCASSSGFEGAGTAQSETFLDYKECMVTAGYRLESY